MAVKKVFITGATGYIGGQALYEVLEHAEGEFEVTALVRTKEKAANLEKKTGNRVKTVVGTLDDLDLIKKEVNASDIIINTADVDHVPSAQAIHDVLVETTSEVILIHTSGTSVVGDPLSKSKKAGTKVYSDIKNIDEINSLPLEQPHRPVDKLILEINEKNPKVKSVVIAPSTIYGQSDGYDNILSIQIPTLIRLSFKNDQAFSVFDGNYIWSRVHIKDLGQLYHTLLDKLLKGQNIPIGKAGYYFGSYTITGEEHVTDSPSEIEFFWKDISQAVANALFERKLVKDKKVEQLDPDTIRSLANFDFAPSLWGTNSRTRGDNGIRVGWKPTHNSVEGFWGSIPQDVDYLITKNEL